MFYNMLLLNYKMSQRCPEEKNFIFAISTTKYTLYSLQLQNYNYIIEFRKVITTFI